ncbi:hypothetical protein HanPSC8_Chr17g0765761 [Helianthus annuus]|nr:hypothetical protein HanPSC8_Chr17g0765761 [Helianthus annuus]
MVISYDYIKCLFKIRIDFSDFSGPYLSLNPTQITTLAFNVPNNQSRRGSYPDRYSLSDCYSKEFGNQRFLAY